MSSNSAKVLNFTLRFFAPLAFLFLAACSFAPVYSNPAISRSNFDLTFDQGNTRLEQIVYADLVAHFGRSTAPITQNVHVAVSSSAITPGKSSVGLQGIITITNNQSDEIVFTGTRTASATYLSSGQSLANQQAANEATERAAHQLAETIRLTLISVLSFPPAQ